jgi:hypothetical protein
MEPGEQVAGRKTPLVVVVAGAEVGLQGGRDLKVGVPQPVHGQHELNLGSVDLHHADVDGDAEEEHERQQHQRQGGGVRPKPVALASSAKATIAADSTLRKIAVRLIASFHSSDRDPIRLQCSVATIATASGPNGCSPTGWDAAVAPSACAAVARYGLATLPLSSVVSIAGLLEPVASLAVPKGGEERLGVPGSTPAQQSSFDSAHRQAARSWVSTGAYG